MDSSIEQFITNVVISIVATIVAAIQTKYESKMLSLCEMIEKSLFLGNSPSTTPKLDSDTSANISAPADMKTTER